MLIDHFNFASYGTTLLSKSLADKRNNESFIKACNSLWKQNTKAMKRMDYFHLHFILLHNNLMQHTIITLLTQSTYIINILIDK